MTTILLYITLSFIIILSIGFILCIFCPFYQWSGLCYHLIIAYNPDIFDARICINRYC